MPLSRAQREQYETALLGQTFHRLTVVAFAGSVRVGTRGRDSVTTWLCKCDCGNEKVVKRAGLVNGTTKSCGCLHKEQSSRNVVQAQKSRRLPDGEAGLNRLYNTYRRGADARNLEFLFDKETFKIEVTKNCFYCGKEPSQTITSSNSSQGSQFLYNGLDRMDNQLGYTLKNCVPACWPCNKLKKANNTEEFLDRIKRIYEHVISGDCNQVGGC